MIIQTDNAMILDTVKPWEQYCTYEHHVSFDPEKPPEVIMVGMCKLVDVYRMADGRTNSEWGRIFGKGGQVMIRIIAIGDVRAEMAKYAANHMRSLPKIPRCNLHGISTRGYSRPIRCENNGTVYASQREACEALGLHQSSMSRHLAGGLSKIGGMVFSYVDGEVA